MTIAGYVPSIDETDLQKINRSIRNLYEGGAASGDLSAYATTASLATVATSGLYSDLTGKPSLSFGSATLQVTDFAITAITKANPCVMTITSHTMIVGDIFFVKSVVGMTQVNYKWYIANAVSGNNVTVNLAQPSSGYLIDLGAVDSTAYSNYTSGGRAYPQYTRGTWSWPANVNYARVTVWGSGGAGGGSPFGQLAGAGGGGARIAGWISRPVSGTSSYIIDRGMPGIQANITSNNNIYSGPTAFGTFTFTAGNPATPTVPSMTGDLYAYGAGIGQTAGGAQIGGDGGTGGVAGGTYYDEYLPGGQGGASIAAIKDFSGAIVNSSFPAGATGAGGGGMGGNNSQDGQYPGGGGASGYNAGTVDVGFDCTATACVLTGGREEGQSGKGGAGLIHIDYAYLA